MCAYTGCPLPLSCLPLRQVYYVVDKANWGGLTWKGGVGYVTKDMVRGEEGRERGTETQARGRGGGGRGRAA